MKILYSPKNNPRVIIIQKLYSYFIDNDSNIEFPKHRFKKFIKDIVKGTIERDDIISAELNNKYLINLNEKKFDLLFKTIIKAATYEFLFKPDLPFKIIIKEYLDASNFFINENQTKFLNALLDQIRKKKDERISNYKWIFFKFSKK